MSTTTLPSRRPRTAYADAPFLVFWETTRACDLACKHCRACAVPERDSRELSTTEGQQLLDSIAATGTRLVVLTGGDPAKRHDLVELVRYGTEIGLRMALTPSATPLITRELLVELREAGLARLAISLDGVPRTHDAFRGVKGSHARTFEILRDARELGITTQVNTSVSRFNQDELPAIEQAIAPLGIELWSVFFVVPTGRGGALACLDEKETEAILVWLSRVAEDSPFDIKTTAAPQFRRVLLQRKTARDAIVGLRSDGIGRAARGVNDGQGTMFVSHVGDVYPSGFLPIPCGNVRASSVASIYRESPLFRALRRPDDLGGKCGACEFRKVCGGSRARAFATTGDALAEDPACPYVPAARRSP